MLQDYPSPSCITWLFSCVFLALLCTHTNTHYIFSHFWLYSTLHSHEHTFDFLTSWLYSTLTRTHIRIPHSLLYTTLTWTHIIFPHTSPVTHLEPAAFVCKHGRHILKAVAQHTPQQGICDWFSNHIVSVFQGAMVTKPQLWQTCKHGLHTVGLDSAVHI